MLLMCTSLLDLLFNFTFENILSYTRIPRQYQNAKLKNNLLTVASSYYL